MNQGDTSALSERESVVESPRAVARSGRESVSKAASALRRGVGSEALPVIVGGAGLVGGLRALLRGERKRGLIVLALGAGFLATAVAERRTSDRGRGVDVDETDVVDTGPDVETNADEAGGVGEEDHATGEAARAVADTSPDVEDASSGLASESDGDAESASVDQREVVDTGVDVEESAEEPDSGEADAGEADGTSGGTMSGAGGTGVGDRIETEAVERLGEAAFDRQSREVPAPQRAFNRGFLAHSAEAFWGIDADDDSVVVSGDYDAVDGRDGVRYVASSAIGEDVRELPIPDAVLDHWDEVFGGGTAVTGGDDILFVTTDELAADGLLRVLPTEWADEESG